MPFDFSLHEESGRKGDGGIGKKQFRRRFSLHREKDNPDYQRELECSMSKLDCTVEMVKRMWKCGLHPRYALADSWFACEDFISFIRKIANGAIHYVGLAKMGATKYVINGKKHNAGELVALYPKIPNYNHKKQLGSQVDPNSSAD